MLKGVGPTNVLIVGLVRILLSLWVCIIRFPDTFFGLIEAISYTRCLKFFVMVAFFISCTLFSTYTCTSANDNCSSWYNRVGDFNVSLGKEERNFVWQ